MFQTDSNTLNKKKKTKKLNLLSQSSNPLEHESDCSNLAVKD